MQTWRVFLTGGTRVGRWEGCAPSPRRSLLCVAQTAMVVPCVETGGLGIRKRHEKIQQGNDPVYLSN